MIELCVFCIFFFLQRLAARVKMIREVVREITGFAPYEKRMMEILKGGGNPQKRAWRFAKRRVRIIRDVNWLL